MKISAEVDRFLPIVLITINQEWLHLTKYSGKMKCLFLDILLFSWPRTKSKIRVLHVHQLDICYIRQTPRKSFSGENTFQNRQRCLYV